MEQRLDEKHKELYKEIEQGLYRELEQKFKFVPYLMQESPSYFPKIRHSNTQIDDSEDDYVPGHS